MQNSKHFSKSPASSQKAPHKSLFYLRPSASSAVKTFPAKDSCPSVFVPGGHTPLPSAPSGCSKFEVCGAYPSPSPGSPDPGCRPVPTPPTTPSVSHPSVKDSYQSVLLPGCLRAHLYPCPEGTRLGEANLHNRGCVSQRETYLRIEAPPVPPPEGRHFFHYPGGGASLLVGPLFVSLETL